MSKKEDEEEDEEEYLQTANWQLGNRRVRCTLMSQTGRRKEERGESYNITRKGKQ